jgi:L-lactate dehydrogenase complex protein LldE
LVNEIGLFVPCYIDQFYPDVGLATLEVLEAQGLLVEFPEQQTCCGQPMANAGCNADARQLARRFVAIFKSYDYIVAPSGSCVAMVRHHYDDFFNGDPDFMRVKERTYELCEFLVGVLGISTFPGSFPHTVGLHQSCHALRELRMGRGTERIEPEYNIPRQLLAGMDGIQFAQLQRADECCGFGGTFAVAEEAVSCMMGLDRLADHEQAGTEVLTAADMSCLMHLDGLNRRRPKPIHVMHIAQILAGRTVPT